MRKTKNIILKKYSYFFLFLVLLWFVLPLFFVPTPLSTLPYSQTIVDIYGKDIWEIQTSSWFRHQKFSKEKIPEFTKKAIIRLEDASFYDNIWIDFSSILRATYKNIESKKIKEWGSTITTQLIKNLYWLNERRTLWRKWIETYLAFAYTLQHTKKDILNAYLETVFFWYQNYGIISASQFYFWKDIENLTPAEQIALLVIPKNSNFYDPFKHPEAFKKRYDIISTYLKDTWIITKEEYRGIQKERLIFTWKGNNTFPYLRDFFQNSQEKNSQDTILQTTIDGDLQNKIEAISKNSISPLAWKQVGDFSVVLVDRQTMELRALIGGTDYSGSGWQINGALAPRQVGSTIKPFTYLLAFQNLWYTAETTISDVPTQFLTDKWYAYTPKNYSLTYKWEVTLAEALSQSINIPAVKIAQEVGVGKLLEFLRKLWITTLEKDEDYYGLALTLGVGEISLYELTQAYSIFAQDGDFCKILLIKNSQKDCKHLVDSKYTDMVNNILSDRYIKLEEFPLYGNLDFARKKVTLKTGTSRNFKDNWTLWFTDNYLIGVWVGNKDGQEMRWVSGATGAGEIFKNIVEELEWDQNVSNASLPKRVSTPYLQITSPLSQSIYQIDASKPLSSQKIKLSFETNIPYGSFEWFIDGKSFSDTFYQVSEGEKIFTLILKNQRIEVGRSESRIEVRK
jgi:penicillin-binding protein 1C